MSHGDTKLLNLTALEEVRIVFLVAPNGSEQSEELRSRKHGAEHLSKTCESSCVLDRVGVVCELDSVFVCFVYACFLFLSVFGWDCWPGFVFGWFFWALTFLFLFGEFDPGSGRTLAACLTHASRTLKPSLLGG